METERIGDYEITPNSKTVDDLYFCIYCKRVYLEKVNCACKDGDKSGDRKC